MMRARSRSLVQALSLAASGLLFGLVAVGCAEGSVEGGGGQGKSLLRSFADDYDAAMEERRHELVARARTIDDIKRIARAERLAAACVPGKDATYSLQWLDQHRDRELRTAQGRRTVEEMAEDCDRMQRKLAQRPIEACGARYVQLERHLSDDDRWSTPRVTRASNGWYMTPCDKTPGTPALRELKEAEEAIRAACDEPKASYYLLARWSEEPGGHGMVATVACLLPRSQRSDWLPGNPALGIK